MKSPGAFEVSSRIDLYTPLRSVAWWLGERDGQSFLVASSRVDPPKNAEQWNEAFAADARLAFDLEEPHLRFSELGWGTRAGDRGTRIETGPFAVWDWPKGRGATLESVCAATGGRLPASAAARLVSQLALSMASADRTLGPRYLPLVLKSTVLLFDTGASFLVPRFRRIEQLEESRFSGNEALNEVGLVSPEQRYAESESMASATLHFADRAVSQKALVYLVGSALFELVTGVGERRVVRTLDVLSDVYQGAHFPLPSDFDILLSPLDQLVRESTKWNPEKRPTLLEFAVRAEHLATELEATFSDQTSLADVVRGASKVAGSQSW